MRSRHRCDEQLDTRYRCTSDTIRAQPTTYYAPMVPPSCTSEHRKRLPNRLRHGIVVISGIAGPSDAKFETKLAARSKWSDKQLWTVVVTMYGNYKRKIIMELLWTSRRAIRGGNWLQNLNDTMGNFLMFWAVLKGLRPSCGPTLTKTPYKIFEFEVREWSTKYFRTYCYTLTGIR